MVKVTLDIRDIPSALSEESKALLTNVVHELTEMRRNVLVMVERTYDLRNDPAKIAEVSDALKVAKAHYDNAIRIVCDDVRGSVHIRYGIMATVSLTSAESWVEDMQLAIGRGESPWDKCMAYQALDEFGHVSGAIRGCRTFVNALKGVFEI